MNNIEKERARFEAWAVAPPREWNIDIAGPKQAWPGQYKLYHVQSAWEAWQARCPEGYSVVPNYMTQKMVNAFNNNMALRYTPVNEVEYRGHHCWKALLAAARQPGDTRSRS